MSRINSILQAANQTSQYIELMRLPEKQQAITKYSALAFEKGKPVLKNTGFVMMNKTQSSIDKTVAFASGYVLGPLVLAKGLFDMKKQSEAGFLQEGLTYGTIGAGAIWTAVGIYKSMCYSKSETLVFPKAPKSLKG
jgi:hypothetical protein